MTTMNRGQWSLNFKLVFQYLFTLTTQTKLPFSRFSPTSQCLKITQNVAFEFFYFGNFTNFYSIKIDLSGNTAKPQTSGFQKLAKFDHFRHF